MKKDAAASDFDQQLREINAELLAPLRLTDQGSAPTSDKIDQPDQPLDDARGVRVLLIEDDSDDSLLIREALADEPGGDYRVDWVRDYDAGLEALVRCEHDICLLDYRLGKRNGLDLLREATLADCAAAVIILTGETDPELDRAASEAGAADFLEKGQISSSSLGRTIRYALKNRRIQDDLARRVAARTELLRSVNENLVISSVHQHELTEKAERAEAAKGVSEARYRVLFDSAPMAIFVCDQDAVIQNYNSIAAQLWGREPTCGVERHCGSTKLWLPGGELLPHTQSPIVEVLRTGIAALNVEVDIERPDGSRLPVLVNFAALKNGDGEITGAITSFVDITERKRLEMNLAFLSQISQELISLRTVDEIMNSVNEKISRYMRLSHCVFAEIDEEAYTADVTHDWHRNDVPGVVGHYRLNEFLSDDFRLAGRAGEIFVVRDVVADPRSDSEKFGALKIGAFTAMPIVKDGKWQFLVAIFDSEPRDWRSDEIDLIRELGVRIWTRLEQARVENALSESEERFRTLADNMSQFAWTADAKGWIYWYNERWYDYTGTTLEEMQGWGWQKVQHPDHVDRVVDKVQRSWDTGEPWEDTFPLRSKDGEYRWFLSRARPIRDAEGNIIRWFGTNTDITESRNAEIELSQSRERLIMAQEAGNVGIWDWDIRKNETYWSQTMWHIYGLERAGHGPPDEEWSKLLHGNDRHRVTTAMQTATRSPSASFRDEFRIIRPDGRIRWIEAIAQVSRSATGEPIRMYGVNIDITRRKEIEERIRISENQLRLVTDTIPALISYVDSGERYRFVNKKYTEWFGLEKEEILGRTIEEVVGAEAYAGMKPNVETVLSGRELVYEANLKYNNIGDRYVRVSYYPDLGIDDRVNGFYALISDMTDLKHSQDLLRASEDRLILMMESVTDYAMLGMDTQGKIESWNRGAEKIFGYTQDEMVGKTCDPIFTLEDRTSDVPAKEMATARDMGRASDDRWHLKKDGSRFFASGVMMPIRVGDELTGYVKILADLTERKRQADALLDAKEQLEMRVAERTRELGATNLALLEEMSERAIAEQERVNLLGRLVTGQEMERRRIARDLHDQLGQRLTALRLKLASLRADVAEHPQFEGSVERVQEIATRLDSEVSFLAWELRPSALDDLGLVEAIATFLREWSLHYDMPSAFHSTQVARVRLSPDAETHLYRITQEALNNITKHAKATQVTVQLERRDDSVILLIADDGLGFDPAAIASSDSESGLGLVGMTERAALIGGKVEIETAPGAGTTIYVRVPVDGVSTET